MNTGKYMHIFTRVPGHLGIPTPGCQHQPCCSNQGTVHTRTEDDGGHPHPHDADGHPWRAVLFSPSPPAATGSSPSIREACDGMCQLATGSALALAASKL